MVNRVSMIKQPGFAELASTVFQNRTSASGAIADTLRLAILRGQLPPGQLMPQEELAKQFGISRAPVRDAFRQLEAEGLMVTYPHRGAVVVRLTPEEIEEVFLIRESLESTALRLAVPRLTNLDFVQAEAVLNQTDADPDTTHMAELNWAFHKSLYSPSRMPRLLKIIRMLNNSALPYHHLGFVAVDIKQESQSGHRRILDACRSRCEDQAVDALVQHLRVNGERIVAHLRQLRQQGLATDSIRP